MKSTIIGIIIWFLCGILAAGMALDQIRDKRCLYLGDFFAGTFVAVLGPISLGIVGLVYLDAKLGCIVPKKNIEEQ